MTLPLDQLRFEAARVMARILSKARANGADTTLLAESFIDSCLAEISVVKGDRYTKRLIGRKAFDPDPYGQSDYSPVEMERGQ